MKPAAIDPSDESHTAKPFLKWAGGKQRLLDKYEQYFPTQFDSYFEPFVGGGAVFFYLWSKGRLHGHVTLSDNNRELVNAYQVVRDSVDELIERLAVHKDKHTRNDHDDNYEHYYYEVRAQHGPDFDLGDVERAARTIYLNKTCFNGLYRVNSRGRFNVPIGRYKNPSILDEDALKAANHALQGVDLQVRDFRRTPDCAGPGDLVYFDPPYDPLSATASFTAYTKGSFGPEDQRELAEVFWQLRQKECLCMLSNSDTERVRGLYDRSAREIVTVDAIRAINSNASRRGSITEFLILSYEPPTPV